MVSSRRTRIIVVMLWTFVLGAMIIGYRSSQQNRDTREFLDQVEEKTRLEPEIAKAAAAAGGGGAGVGAGPGAGAGIVGSNNDGGSGGGGAKDLTNDPGQPFNPEREYSAILSESPIVIFSKSYCPHSKAVKEILFNEYQITPQPWVVELDMHPHGRELQQYIGDVTGRHTVPNVHVNKVSRGGGDEFRALNNGGNLAETMHQWSDSNFRVKKLPTPPGGGI